MFISAFDTRIGQKPLAEHDKLYYLNQFLRGTPRELISGCFHDAINGYREAREILETEYGHPYKLAMVCVNQISGWPHVKAYDAQGLKRFACLLKKCQSAMSSTAQTHMLDHPTTLLSVVEKLPSYLQNKWREKAHAIGSLIPVRFSDLVHFVDNAAQVANDPVFGRVTAQRADCGTRSPVVGHSVHITAAIECKCTYCGASHRLDACSAFSSIPIDERRDFVKTNRLCFACFGTGHMSRHCSTRLTCAICSKRHPTVLHFDGFSRRESARNAKQTSQVNERAIDGGGLGPTSSLSNSCILTRSDIAVPSTSAHASNASHCLLPILPVRVHQKGSQSFTA